VMWCFHVTVVVLLLVVCCGCRWLMEAVAVGDGSGVGAVVPGVVDGR